MDLAVFGTSTHEADPQLRRSALESVEANSLGRAQKSFWEKFVVCIGGHELFSPEVKALHWNNYYTATFT